MANNRIVSYTASCDSGYQLNSLGECIACPIGQYRNATETRTCTSCPAGFITLNQASKSRLDCNIGKLLLAVHLYVFQFVCLCLASLSAYLCSLLSSSTSVSMSVYLCILLCICLHLYPLPLSVSVTICCLEVPVCHLHLVLVRLVQSHF